MNPDPKLGRAWLLLCVAFGAHIADEALTGFLSVYNPTVMAFRARMPWLPLPTFRSQEFLVGMISVTLLAAALSPLFFRGVRWARPLAYFFAWVNIVNALGHTLGTILGHTVASVQFSRPAPGFYSSPFLFLASLYVVVCLRRTARMSAAQAA